jgi:hypothetical protein
MSFPFTASPASDLYWLLIALLTFIFVCGGTAWYRDTRDARRALVAARDRATATARGQTPGRAGHVVVRTRVSRRTLATLPERGPLRTVLVTNDTAASPRDSDAPTQPQWPAPALFPQACSLPELGIGPEAARGRWFGPDFAAGFGNNFGMPASVLPAALQHLPYCPLCARETETLARALGHPLPPLTHTAAPFPCADHLPRWLAEQATLGAPVSPHVLACHLLPEPLVVLEAGRAN